MQTDMMELMSSPLDSPAKTLVLASEMQRELMASAVVYGQKSPELLAEYVHDGSYWRTCQLCLVEEWEELSETWPQSGMTRNGKLYQLQQSEQFIGEVAFGLLPTIPATEYKGCQKYRYRGSKGFRGSKMSEGLRTSPDDLPCTHPNFAEAMLGYPKDYTLLETP
tara:strand:- start:199 stop:693 length:495 start_codon:yes stop_codon:yes gene_type:complete